MSIVSTDQEVVVEDSKSRGCELFSGNIDLLNYSGARSETISSSESDKSSGHLDLLLKPSEINRLIQLTSQDDDCALLSPSCGVAKKPGFYLKQDMKTVSKVKGRKYQDESDCVLETLLPRVPSRCRNNFSSHSLLRRDSSDSRNGDRARESSNVLSVDTEEEFSGDEAEKNILDGDQDLLLNKKTQHSNIGSPVAHKGKEDLLSDEWLYSLNPRIFCKKRDSQEPTSFSDQSLMLKDTKMLRSVKLNSLNDLTLPFYRIQRKVVEREVEKDLRSMGFTNDTEVNWNALYYPKRRDVLRLIHYRLCNHISPDIVVVLDDKEFFCHRILLQSYSEYFDDLKNGDTAHRVDITNMSITENAFLTIYTWMLTVGQGGFQLLTMQNILEVLLACQTLRIKDLENQCMSFLENDEIFNEEMAYFLFQNASELRMRSIQNIMIPRIKSFFLILVCSKDFIELPIENLTVFLQSDNISVHCELEVFFAAVRWLRHLVAERKEYVGQVMSCIRFGLITPLELVDLRKTEQIDLAEIVTNSKVQKLIDEGLAIAVKNTLCRGDEDVKNTYLNQVPPRNWLGKSKTYKSYQDFIEFLKEIKRNPRTILHSENRESCRSEVSEYPKRERNEYQLQISEKSGGSLTLPDSGITSKSHSKEAKVNQAQLMVFRNDKLDVSTNTCNDYNMYCVTPSYINELIKNESTGKLDDVLNIRRPEAKISEPVIQSRGCVSRPCLRDQAATVIQAAYRGHATRLRLLKALSNNPPRVESSINNDHSSETIPPYPSPLECTRRSSSHLTISHLNSETKLQEELTKHGSTFHLFQNSILVFGGLDPTSNLGPGNSCCTVYRYIADKNKWEIFGNLPEPRYYHDVAILKGRVYLAGGVDPKREDLEERAVCKTVWSLDPNSGVWQKECDMQTERKNFGLVAAWGHLYAIGGHNNESQVISSVERYDPMLKKWTYVASLEHGRTGAAVCKHNHMIWVAGGISAPVKHQVIKQVECYDPKRDVWMTKSPLRFGRAFGRLVSLRGSLYFVGGASKKSSTAATSTPAIDVWDERNKEWKLKTEMSIPRHNHSVAYVGSQMVILGGTTTMSMRCVTTVESWCVNRGSWIRGITSLPAPLIGHSTVTLPLDVP